MRIGQRVPRSARMHGAPVAPGDVESRSIEIHSPGSISAGTRNPRAGGSDTGVQFKLDAIADGLIASARELLSAQKP